MRPSHLIASGCGYLLEWAGICLGAVLHMAGSIMVAGHLSQWDEPSAGAWLCGTIGGAILSICLIPTVREMGRRRAWAILGVFGFLGVVVLLMQPSRCTCAACARERAVA